VTVESSRVLALAEAREHSGNPDDGERHVPEPLLGNGVKTLTRNHSCA
jgi:hypothetical protein